MPTHPQAFAAVAATLGHIDPSDDEAVTMFYRRRFVNYPPQARALIADFLIGLTEMPSQEALHWLRHAVAGPAADIAPIEAPCWDARYGDDMEYVTSDAVVRQVDA